MKMRVAFGADHGGYSLKNHLLERLKEKYTVTDFGAVEFTEDDYPDYTLPVARAVASGEVGRGVVNCGSGVGACIAANKVPEVKACVCHDTYSAHQGVEHDDMNLLCLGARIIGIELAFEIIEAFLEARFSGEERHKRRLEKVKAIEEQVK